MNKICERCPAKAGCNLVREFVNRLLRRAICVDDGHISTLVHVEDVCKIGDDILLSEGEGE